MLGQVFPPKYAKFLYAEFYLLAHTHIKMRSYKIVIFSYVQNTFLSTLSFLASAEPPGSLLVQSPLLLRSYYKNATVRTVVNSMWPQEHSKDHQGQVSIIATHQSLMVGIPPQRSQSQRTTHNGVGPISLYTLRVISWCARASAAP
jgi:hypothetical protein